MGEHLTLDDWKNIATIIGVIVAMFTFWKAIIEYQGQGKQKRAEYLFELHKKLKDNATFKTICRLLDSDSKSLQEIPFADKRDFLGLFQEIAIMKNSGLIAPTTAYYIFGYYAVRCWESKNFWDSLNRKSSYWMIFRDFAEEAILFEKTPGFHLEKKVRV